jgi:hypothetical protein
MGVQRKHPPLDDHVWRSCCSGSSFVKQLREFKINFNAKPFIRNKSKSRLKR